MLATVAIPLTCWLCVLIVTPHKPRSGNEVQELVYTRLLGRQHVLLCVATLVTVWALLVGVIAMPLRINVDLERFRAACHIGNQYSEWYAKEEAPLFPANGPLDYEGAC